MHRRVLVAAIAAAFATGCYHWAEVTTTWNGRGQRPISFDHVVTIFATSDERLRRAMEDHLVAAFPYGAASHRVLGAIGPDDIAAVRRALDHDRFDSAIIMTVVQADSQPASFIAILPRPHHPLPSKTFVEQWERVWNPPFDPAFVPANRLVAIELQVYSLNDDRLVWAGRGDAGDAKTLMQLGNAAAANLPRELAREGLIALEPRVNEARSGE